MMDTGIQQYQKKILPYLDGSLSAEDKNEFEAFVLTHPEFESQIRVKQEELDLIRRMIPAAMMNRETEVNLENEVRTSIFNLLKGHENGVWNRMKDAWEDLISR